MGSKLAGHVQNPSDAAKEYLRKAVHPAIKCMGGTTPEWVRDHIWPAYDQARLPHPMIWRREWVDADEQKSWVEMGAAGADLFFERTIGGYEAWRGLTNVVESVNEFITWTDEDARLLNEFEAQSCYRFHGAGFQVIVGNDSVGWRHIHQWQFYRETLEAADFLGLHEYAWPEGKAGDDQVPFLWHPWRVLRYRKVIEELDDLGYPCPPILLTEISWDRAVWYGGHVGFWGAPDPHAFFTFLCKYDAEIQTDDKVRFAAIFQTGANQDWQSFDLAPHAVGNIMADYMRVAAMHPGQTSGDLSEGPEPEPELPDAGQVPETGLTDAEIQGVRRWVGTEVPASFKWFVRQGMVPWGEPVVVEGKHVIAAAFDPAYNRDVAVKFAWGTWEPIDQKPL